MDADLAYWAERAGAILLTATLVAMVSQRLPKLLQLPAVLAITVAAALIRIDGRTAVDFVYSWTGALSAASFLLLGWAIWRSVRWRQPPPDRRYGFGVLAIMLLGLGVALYAPGLGVGPFDPYRYGFGGWQLPAVLLALLLAGFLLRAWAVAVWLAAAAGLFLSGLHPSLNLWDSLIDPLAATLALLALPASLFRRRVPAEPGPA